MATKRLVIFNFWHLLANGCKIFYLLLSYFEAEYGPFFLALSIVTEHIVSFLIGCIRLACHFFWKPLHIGLILQRFAFTLLIPLYILICMKWYWFYLFLETGDFINEFEFILCLFSQNFFTVINFWCFNNPNIAINLVILRSKIICDNNYGSQALILSPLDTKLSLFILCYSWNWTTSMGSLSMQWIFIHCYKIMDFVNTSFCII